MSSSKPITFQVPLLGFCAFGSGIGKTTLLTSLIPLLTRHGLRISVIKHAHHTFDIDHPGKDSFRLRESGAVQMLLGSRHRWALMTELSRIEDRSQQEPDLTELLPQIDASIIDLVMVEGFKHAPIAKIEVYRPQLNKPLLADNDAHIIAIASDGAVNSQLPVLDLNNPDEIADFILAWLRNQQPNIRLVSAI